MWACFARKPVNHTISVALVKSIGIRCVIEHFCGVIFCLSHCFQLSVGIGAFFIRPIEISSFFIICCPINFDPVAKTLSLTYI